MKVLLFIVVLSFAILSVVQADAESAQNNIQPIQPLISGGVDAREGEFPHICSLQRTFLGISQHICGASIVNSLWLVTGGYCFTATSNFGNLDALCGQVNLASTSLLQQRVRILQSFVHPNYTGGPNDIALARLVSHLHFTTHVQPVQLPAGNVIPFGIATLIGWGGSEDGLLIQSLGNLQMNRVTVMTPGSCEAILAEHGQLLYTSNICSGPVTGGLTPCYLDEGSSLTLHNNGSVILIGIVSLPTPCGSPGFPGRYTNVSQFAIWINSVIAEQS